MELESSSAIDPEAVLGDLRSHAGMPIPITANPCPKAQQQAPHLAERTEGVLARVVELGERGGNHLHQRVNDHVALIGDLRLAQPDIAGAEEALESAEQVVARAG